ncbi:hypothetical protein Scep_004994 [Stephania cephalantha]|uniref:Uncharacterized protein n=1 Tax=Stephania cephalantha TaxID=152367 RepID=A0AAP0KUE0_9MAGN
MYQYMFHLCTHTHIQKFTRLCTLPTDHLCTRRTASAPTTSSAGSDFVLAATTDLERFSPTSSLSAPATSPDLSTLFSAPTTSHPPPVSTPSSSAASSWRFSPSSYLSLCTDRLLSSLCSHPRLSPLHRPPPLLYQFRFPPCRLPLSALTASLFSVRFRCQVHYLLRPPLSLCTAASLPSLSAPPLPPSPPPSLPDPPMLP